MARPLLPTEGYAVAVPVTVQGDLRRAVADVPYHPSYTGSVLFRNTFDGQLPATDYPKVHVSEYTNYLLYCFQKQKK